MQVPRALVLSLLLSVLVLGCVAAADPPTEEHNYAIEINGTLCGYSNVRVWPSELDGQPTILQEQKIFMMLSALGMELNTEIQLTYHIDPDSGQFVFVDSEVTQGRQTRRWSARVEGSTAHVVSAMKAGEQAIELTPEMILPGTLYLPHLKRDFVDQGLESKTYSILEVVEGELQDTKYTRVGTEELVLDDRKFAVVVLDSRNLKTGIKSRQWIEHDTAQVLKIEFPDGRTIYLSDPSVSKRIELANLDQRLISKTNVTIADIQGISYMKVQATIEPTGLTVTAEDLNVPGQVFHGTVDENRVEGVFEIEHLRFDGAGAPPFPPEFSSDGTLAPFLEPSGLIESTDPVLIEQAKKITTGAADSWDATKRIAEWVAKNIDYAIPGGGTSRKTFDTRTGECGAHSNLVAAFCRAVGIPARVVWGCMYVPSHGGAFGQHGWNEVYMGEAGWIPLDATANETDFVDSGHIRIGIHQVAATALNPIVFEVLDHRVRVGDAPPVESGKYGPYVGDYSHQAAGKTFTVLVQDGALAVDIPGQLVVVLNEPDDEGRWYAKISPSLFFTFETVAEGRRVSLVVHEIVRLQRIRDPEETDPEAPERDRPYLGVYHLAQLNAEFTVIYEGEALAIVDPLQNATVGLQPPDQQGRRIDEYGKNTIWFEENDADGVRAMVIDAATRFKKNGDIPDF